MAVKIEEGFSFRSKMGPSEIITYKSAMDLFSKGFEAASKLKDDIAIFVDTNVLLRYYSVSYTDRSGLLKFFTEQKDRIYITKQVQEEFTKNREDVVNKYLERVTNKIPKDFNADVINSIGNFLDQNKTILKDYNEFGKKLEKLKSECENLNKALLLKIKESVDGNKNLLSQDDFLAVLSTCKLVNNIITDEQEFLKKEYDLLRKDIPIDKLSTEINKPNAAFPGMGDIREKPDDPYGDYIIFHEMLKWVKEEKKHIVFLTYDTTKGDWLNMKKAPHLHYVVNTYRNTDKIIYILDADRVFEDVLNVQLEPLISTIEDIPEIPLTIENFEKYILGSSMLNGLRIPDRDMQKSSFYELQKFGYNNIDSVLKDFNCSIRAAKEYMKKNTKDWSKTGVLRLALSILYDNFQSNLMEEIQKDARRDYKKYLDLN